MFRLIKRLYVKIFVKKNVVSFDLDAIFHKKNINWELIQLIKLCKKVGCRIALITNYYNTYEKINVMIEMYELPVDIVKFMDGNESKGDMLYYLGVILHFNKPGNDEITLKDNAIEIISVYQDGFVGIEKY